MYFDGSSGGVCRVGVITKDGIDREVRFIISHKYKIERTPRFWIWLIFFMHIRQVFFAPIDAVPTQSETLPTVSAVRS